MKKIYLFGILVAVLSLTNCKKETTAPPANTGAPSITVAEENTALVNKFTATWCGPCGSWGWDLFENVIEENANDAIYMGTYSSSSPSYDNTDFYNTIADTFYNSFAPGKGIPAFCV